VANVVADDLDTAADGSFEFVVSGQERPGNWMPLPPGSSSLVVRQFFYDWNVEEAARLEIDCLDAADLERPHPGTGSGGTEEAMPGAGELSAAGVGRQLAAIGEFVRASLAFWLDVEEGGRAQGVNAFREPAARTDIGGAAENVTVWGSWELEADQALVVEVTPPPALYWSVALGNHWWETIDYANHQSSLNGHQAVVDADGVFRAVVARRDPGVANWLDTAGHRQGPIIFRWLRADDAPVPRTRLVRLDELAGVLPPDTALVDPATRAVTIRRRRAGVRRRFPR
jgi:hypothetical protein